MPHTHALATADWVESRQTEDIDQHAAAQAGWHLAYEQFSEGSFAGRVLKVHLPGLTLFREDCNVATRQRGRLAPDSYGFALPLRHQAELFFNGQPVPADAIMCGKGDEVDMTTPPDFTLLAVAVERALLGPLWESMYHKPLAHWLEQQLVLETTADKAEGVRRLQLAALAQAERLHAGGLPATLLERLRDDVLLEWMEALPPAVDTSELATLARRKRLVDRACELMLSRPEEPISVLALCSALGTSRRRLHYCFQEVLGTTPAKYLRMIRLNGAHRALRGGGAASSVQAVAAHWGFWHLSQFAQDYRRQFGERPSETLKRTRGPAG